jgi:5-methylthioadenosine/S-adenosylhomocysteine deaminase
VTQLIRDFSTADAALKRGQFFVCPCSGFVDLKDEDIFRCATVNGASYAQVNAGLSEGCAADILLVELDHCRMVGDYNLTANLVYSADSSVMHTLICNGRVIMENHRVPGEEEIIADARRCCDKFRR